MNPSTDPPSVISMEFIKHGCSIIENKWTIAVLSLLIDRPKRYFELQNQIATISPKILSYRLKQLLELQLIHKQSFNTVPPSVLYSITNKGLLLKDVVLVVNQAGSQLAQLTASDNNDQSN